MNKYTSLIFAVIVVLILVFGAACGNNTTTNNSVANTNSTNSINKPTNSSSNSNSSTSNPATKHFNSCEDNSEKECFQYSFDYPGNWKVEPYDEQGFKGATFSDADNKHTILFFKNLISFGTVADDRGLYFDEIVDSEIEKLGAKKISCVATSIKTYKGFQCYYKSDEDGYIVRWITLPQKSEHTVLFRIKSGNPEEVKDVKKFDSNPELAVILNSLKVGS